MYILLNYVDKMRKAKTVQLDHNYKEKGETIKANIMERVHQK